MKEPVLSDGIENFIRDFEHKSTTEVFESGKEKDGIIQIAQAKMGINLKNNTDLAGFKTIYTFSDIANGNKARLPKDQLLKALPTIIGKPVNINHIRNYVVGYYIDYRYIESENKVIAYGIFFKSNFGNEWSEAKKLLSSRQLGTSHEVWCPKDRRRYLPDGTYEAHSLEFAGGALIYRNQMDWQNPDRKIDTAFKGCDVLELAMDHINKHTQDHDLLVAAFRVPAKKSFQPEDLIVANDAQQFLKRSEEEITKKVETGSHKAYQETVPVPAPAVPQVPVVKCENCGNQWETQQVGDLQCSQCKAIVDRTGKMLYPPQVISFNFREPNTGSTNWRLLSDSKDKALIKNLDSNRIYELTFAQGSTKDDLMGKLNFVYMGTASCPQCGKTTNFSTVSNVENYGIDCPRCELHYTQNIQKQTVYRKIKSYRDVTDELKNQSQQDGNSNVNEQTKELQTASVEPPAVVVEEQKVDLELSSQVTDKTSPAKNDNSKFREKAKKLVRKMHKKVRELKKKSLETASLKSATELEIAKIKTDADQKIGFYKTNAVELVKRRELLAKFGDDLSDEKIMDETSYAKARLEQENALLKASLANGTAIVGDKAPVGRSDAEISSLKKEINSKAFKK